MADVKKKTLKRRIFDIIQIGNKDDFISRSFDWFIVTIIILNILTVFLDTFEELAGLRSFFRTIEAGSVLSIYFAYGRRICSILRKRG